MICILLVQIYLGLFAHAQNWGGVAVVSRSGIPHQAIGRRSTFELIYQSDLAGRYGDTDFNQELAEWWC